MFILGDPFPLFPASDKRDVSQPKSDGNISLPQTGPYATIRAYMSCQKVSIYQLIDSYWDLPRGWSQEKKKREITQPESRIIVSILDVLILLKLDYCQPLKNQLSSLMLINLLYLCLRIIFLQYLFSLSLCEVAFQMSNFFTSL